MGGELGTTRDPQTPSHRSALASGLFRFTQLIMNKYKNKKINPEGIFLPASNYGTNRSEFLAQPNGWARREFLFAAQVVLAIDLDIRELSPLWDLGDKNGDSCCCCSDML